MQSAQVKNADNTAPTALLGVVCLGGVEVEGWECKKENRLGRYEIKSCSSKIASSVKSKRNNTRERNWYRRTGRYRENMRRGVGVLGGLGAPPSYYYYFHCVLLLAASGIGRLSAGFVCFQAPMQLSPRQPANDG